MEKVFAVDIGTVFTPAKNFATFGDLVSVLLKNSLVIAGVTAFVLLIVAGFGFIVAAGSGDAKRIEQTRTSIMVVLIGLALVAASVWIVQIIEKVIGRNVISP